ncbi:hypothetical protein BDV26DRAFT_93704 [Aspergillus bertholletiae]|uniref:Uncharacterized protein n=1 Tax=Aspergillus bertholletiae TaxID=1226010 RepID=A0A5N7BPT3_9EURO|nr:hypothetical protein BDV26DRAFT_93704 [Aspergillus bertholletiae]
MSDTRPASPCQVNNCWRIATPQLGNCSLTRESFLSGEMVRSPQGERLIITFRSSYNHCGPCGLTTIHRCSAYSSCRICPSPYLNSMHSSQGLTATMAPCTQSGNLVSCRSTSQLEYVPIGIAAKQPGDCEMLAWFKKTSALVDHRGKTKIER